MIKWTDEKGDEYEFSGYLEGAVFKKNGKVHCAKLESGLK